MDSSTKRILLKRKAGILSRAKARTQKQKMLQVARNVFNKHTELKSKIFSASDSACVSGAGLAPCLTDISEGLEQTNRVGRQIELIGIRMRVLFTSTQVITPKMVRCYLVRHKLCTGTLLSFSDAIPQGGTDIDACYVPTPYVNDKVKFRVFKDQQKLLGSATDDGVHKRAMFYINYRFRNPLKVTYAGSNGTDESTNQVQLVMTTEHAANVQVSYYGYVLFRDA